MSILALASPIPAAVLAQSRLLTGPAERGPFARLPPEPRMRAVELHSVTSSLLVTAQGMFRSHREGPRKILVDRLQSLTDFLDGERIAKPGNTAPSWIEKEAGKLPQLIARHFLVPDTADNKDRVATTLGSPLAEIFGPWHQEGDVRSLGGILWLFSLALYVEAARATPPQNEVRLAAAKVIFDMGQEAWDKFSTYAGEHLSLTSAVLADYEKMPPREVDDDLVGLNELELDAPEGSPRPAAVAVPVLDTMPAPAPVVRGPSTQERVGSWWIERGWPVVKSTAGFAVAGPLAEELVLHAPWTDGSRLGWLVPWDQVGDAPLNNPSVVLGCTIAGACVVGGVLDVYLGAVEDHFAGRLAEADGFNRISYGLALWAARAARRTAPLAAVFGGLQLALAQSGLSDYGATPSFGYAAAAAMVGGTAVSAVRHLSGIGSVAVAPRRFHALASIAGKTAAFTVGRALRFI